MAELHKSREVRGLFDISKEIGFKEPGRARSWILDVLTLLWWFVEAKSKSLTRRKIDAHWIGPIINQIAESFQVVL